MVAPKKTKSSESAKVTLPRKAKGKRPQFYSDPAVDQLFAIVTALTAELWVARDRSETLERLLAARGVIAADAVDSYVPAGEDAEGRAAEREELIQRVFAVLETYTSERS